MYKEGYGNIPNKDKIIDYLEKAYDNNPGKWIAKAWRMGQIAEKMADDLDLDSDIAFACGSLARLSDGYEEGFKGNICAYEILRAEPHLFPARISLTRSFPIKDINYCVNELNISAKEKEFVNNFLYKYSYAAYDYLIQYLDFLVGREDLSLDCLKDLDHPHGKEISSRIYDIRDYFTKKLEKPIETYMPKTKRYKFPYRLFPKDK